MDKAEEYSKCMGTRMGLAQICSKLVEMDCYNTGGQCCASNSDGTGTVSTAEKTSEDLCGYCFTGKPATLMEQALLEGVMHIYTVTAHG